MLEASSLPARSVENGLEKAGLGEEVRGERNDQGVELVCILGASVYPLVGQG